MPITADDAEEHMNPDSRRGRFIAPIADVSASAPTNKFRTACAASSCVEVMIICSAARPALLAASAISAAFSPRRIR